MAKTYYTLAQRIDGKWTPQFGDYDRVTVEEEMREYRDGYQPVRIKAGDMRIVKSGDKQADINAALAKLNAKEGGTLDAAFEEVANEQRAQAERNDADPAYQAKVSAKRAREEAAKHRTTLTPEEAAAEAERLADEDQEEGEG